MVIHRDRRAADYDFVLYIYYDELSALTLERMGREENAYFLLTEIRKCSKMQCEKQMLSV